MDEKAIQELKAYIREEAENARRGAVHDMNVILENTVNKQLQLLVEGQQTLLQTMAPKSRVEALEEEVILLKEVLRAHSREIAELKKAQ